MENIAQELLELFLPSEIDWKRYKLSKVEEIKDENISPFVGRLEFHLEELNIIPNNEEYKGKQIISKGFYPSKKIHDFAVRDKLSTLVVKRRKWQEKEGGKIINSEINCNYPGTQTSKSLLSFLK
ncbi:hypothetical protein CSB07_01285 [Candidatus Gracilibacteria bacterium]|nr:MAG: hypothetical protein CSB07_01285 [Candidatus Gracilibacteria bacterium]PIE85087.1 MAG: hypothetical protein CSA08_04050 [Candidatus Gracilibacteria bacterium]